MIVKDLINELNKTFENNMDAFVWIRPIKVYGNPIKYYDIKDIEFITGAADACILKVE